MIEIETNHFTELLYFIERYYHTLKYLKIAIIGIKKNDNFYDDNNYNQKNIDITRKILI